MGRSRHGGMNGWGRDDCGGDAAGTCSVKFCTDKIPCSSEAWIISHKMDCCPVSHENKERMLWHQS